MLDIGYFRKYIRNTRKVRNVVLEKDGDQLDRSFEKWGFT